MINTNTHIAVSERSGKSSAAERGGGGAVLPPSTTQLIPTHLKFNFKFILTRPHRFEKRRSSVGNYCCPI